MSTVKRPGTPPTKEFLKKFSQAKANVHEGIIYGTTKIADKKPLKRILERVISQAIVPPKPMAMAQVAKEISTVFQRGL